jgi:hypothetical protein
MFAFHPRKRSRLTNDVCRVSWQQRWVWYSADQRREGVGLKGCEVCKISCNGLTSIPSLMLFRFGAWLHWYQGVNIVAGMQRHVDWIHHKKESNNCRIFWWSLPHQITTDIHNHNNSILNQKFSHFRYSQFTHSSTTNSATSVSAFYLFLFPHFHINNNNNELL